MLIENFSDAGHSWYAVRRTTISCLGLLDKISGFSYQKDKMVYLEEDYDAGLVLSALKKAGVNFERHYHKSTSGDSFVRSFNRFLA